MNFYISVHYSNEKQISPPSHRVLGSTSRDLSIINRTSDCLLKTETITSLCPCVRRYKLNLFCPSCLRIRLAEGKKQLTFLWLYFSCWVYNRVGVSGGILPRENLNFQNLRNAIFGLLALMFALLQKLSLLNLQAIFLVTPPLHTIFFRLAPPLKPYFFTCPPLKSHQRPLPHKK